MEDKLVVVDGDLAEAVSKHCRGPLLGLFGECRRENHGLCVMRLRSDYLSKAVLVVFVHEQVIGFVDYQELQVREVELLALHKVCHAAERANDDRGILLLQLFDLDVDGNLADEGATLGLRKVLGEALELVRDLSGELACVAEHEALREHLLVRELQHVQDGKDEDASLPLPGLCLDAHVSALEAVWNRDGLDVCGPLESVIRDCLHNLRFEVEVGELCSVLGCVWFLFHLGRHEG